MKIYPILNKPGKGKYVFIFILNERAVITAGSTGKCKISDLFEELGFRV
ncbi:hypothetical protein [Paramuribaculum intestinale]|nr:hypothetical protein [Paramuribaculum intestinale]